jgi:AcrR family transcriptional regulator
VAITATDAPVKTGLRERKKAKTRALIQAEALRLFREVGYDATTIEQISEVAEVSPSTFFRYFPTKEAVVMWDQFDSRLETEYRGRPAKQAPVDALRSAFAEVFGSLSVQEVKELKQRTELMGAVPSLRAAMFDQIGQALQGIAAVTAERTGRSPDDFAVKAMAGAELGIAIAATFHLADHPRADLATLIDEGIVALSKGFKGL